MSDSTSGAGRVPDYDYAPPTESDVRGALVRHFGRAEADRLWEDALRAAGLRRAGGFLRVDELQLVGEQLAAQPGVARVFGRSLLIRIRTYRILAARRFAVTGSPGSRPPVAPRSTDADADSADTAYTSQATGAAA